MLETDQNLGGEHSDRRDRPNQHDEPRSRPAPEEAVDFVVEGPALPLFTPQVLDGLRLTSKMIGPSVAPRGIPARETETMLIRELLGPASACRHVEICGDAVRRFNRRLHAIITVTADAAARRARKLDELGAYGRSQGILHGLVFTLKDVIDEAGVRTTDGANFGERIPRQDAAIVERLRHAGAIFIGKANLHEFAYGGTSQNPFWGSCRNAWDPERIPGGSSGGSATSVAAGMCHVSIGTDTGGSGRLPAALCGVAGLRPTPGRVSIRGITPLSPAFDTASPLARRVRDVARSFIALAGYDVLDPYSVDMPLAPILVSAPASLSGVRIGLPRNPYFTDGIDPGVAARIDDAIRVLERLGARLFDVHIPRVEEAPGHFEKLMHTDGAAIHRDRLATAPERFGADIRERLEKLGGQVSGRDYAAAQQWGVHWRHELDAVLATVDAVAYPSAPGVAPLVSECLSTTTITRRLAAFCYPWSLAMVPVLSVPCGLAEDDMPCGLSIVARRWREEIVLRIGEAYQQATDWHLQEPPLLRDQI